MRGSCILVGDQFCSWLPHVGFLGLKLTGVLLRSDSLLSLLEAKVGNVCDVLVGDWKSAQMNADVVLVDGPACAEVIRVASRSGARLILSTKRRRKMPSGLGWMQVCRERISHQFVGGVTERVVDLSVFRSLGAPLLRVGPALVKEVLRGASTVLSLKEYCKYFRPIPTNKVVEPLSCVNLGTADRPYYHGRGLLPKALTRDTWLVHSSVASSGLSTVIQIYLASK